MSRQEQLKPQLAMVLPDLSSVPALEPPAGYRIRTFSAGDEAAWCEIIAESFQMEAGPDCFDRMMRSDFAFRPHRILFIEHDGLPVATASAWYRPSWGRDTGYLHMVGVRPSHSGRRLGLIVSAAALALMAGEGRRRAVLQTDDFRIPAVKTYLRLGFEPLLVDENQRRRWKDVFRAIGRPELDAQFAETLCGPLFEPAPERPDGFDTNRYVRRRKWLTNREHRGGPTGGGDMDMLGDESLYRPSCLGRAGAHPHEVQAGATAPLTLWFEAGPAGVPEATEVRFAMRGQSPLGVQFQASRPDAPGFITLAGPAHCELEPLAPGFRVKKGHLREGERVEIRAGGTEGFQWTKLAGRREFKVVFEYPDGAAQERLPEPVVIVVKPREARRLEATVPCTRSRQGPIRLYVTARDEFDNRAMLAGHLHIKGSADPAALVDGKAECRIAAPREGIVRLRVRHEELPGAYTSNACVPTDDLHLYVGDLHAHDFLSEAEGYTDAVYRWAIEERNLDFLSVPVQSHGWQDNDKWAIAKYMNERFLEEGRFVTFLSFEWQHSAYGDKVVHFLGGDHPYLPVDDPRYNTPDKLHEALRASDAVVIAHHPGYPLNQHVPGTDFDAVETDVERLVEIWSMHGSSEGYDPNDRPLRGFDPERNATAALMSGLRLGLVGGSDTHSGRPGGSAKEPLGYWGGLAAVWAASLTRRDIFSALRARRTCALTGARIVLDMHVNGHAMGADAPEADEARIRIDVWAAGEIRKVELLKNAAVLRKWLPEGDEFHVEEEDKTEGQAFYHCRVTQTDGHLAVCSPVWVG